MVGELTLQIQPGDAAALMLGFGAAICRLVVLAGARVPTSSPPSRVLEWLGAGRPPWLCWPLPQLGPGSASNPGQAQPVGSAWASGPAAVPRQGGACPAPGTRSSVLRQHQRRAVPGAPSPCLTWTSVGASLVVCPSQSHPPVAAPLLTMGPGKDWSVLPVLCSGLCRAPSDVRQLTTAFAIWRDGRPASGLLHRSCVSQE